MIRSTLSPKINFRAFREVVLLLTRHQQLTLEMAKREISDRYVGQFFSGFWALGHPLILILIYIFIFSYVFKVKVGGTVDLPLDYTVYLLSGLIPWLSFQESMSKASTVITTNANLVKQVIFPIGVLPIKGVLATLVTQLIFLVLLIFYLLIKYGALSWTYLLLPVLIFLQALAMIGVSYLLSAVGAFFRDIKEFVQVLSVAGMYLMPIFYLPEFVPGVFRNLLYLNPFSYLVWCFQDILYFGRFEHPFAWPVLFFLCFGIFVFGYRTFRKLSTLFGNVL